MIEVLLVDDESYMVESLQQTIPWKEMGVRNVYIASSASEALKILEEQSVDIVVTDIRMPVMSGLELIEMIRRKWKYVKCILLTGYADFEYAKKAIQLHAFDYLLKPVDDQEFIDTVSNAIEVLKDDWKQIERSKTSEDLDLSTLRTNLMHDLLLGRRLSRKMLEKKLSAYEIPVQIDDLCVMLLLKFEKEIDDYGVSIEDNLTDIIQEVFTTQFRVWYDRGPHDHLLLIITLKDDIRFIVESNGKLEPERRKHLEETVMVLRQRVINELKRDVTILVTQWFIFPEELMSIYRTGLAAFFKRERMVGEGVIFLENESNKPLAIKSIESLYKPPTLIHLLESNQWEAAETKINDIFTELNNKQLSNEHVYEVFFAISNAFVFLAHKQGQLLSDIDHRVIDVLMGKRSFYTLEKLREWTFETFGSLKKELRINENNSKKFIIKQVQKMVAEKLNENISVKTIAERVYLHPVYLSKIYKMETGESLGDYIIRMKMEKAAFLLKNSNKRIYEITSELGYQNPQYFSKMFKKIYGMAPQEYRDK